MTDKFGAKPGEIQRLIEKYLEDIRNSGPIYDHACDHWMGTPLEPMKLGKVLEGDANLRKEAYEREMLAKLTEKYGEIK